MPEPPCQLSGLHWLTLTSFSDEQAMLDALLADASVCMLKDFPGASLAGAVRHDGVDKSLLDTRAARPF